MVLIDLLAHIFLRNLPFLLYFVCCTCVQIIPITRLCGKKTRTNENIWQMLYFERDGWNIHNARVSKILKHF